MNCTKFKILKNYKIAKDTFLIELEGDTSCIQNAGQFVNISVSSFYLRRPISICHFEKNILTLIYKVVGKGTFALSQKKPNHMLDILLPLGNGFDIDKPYSKAVLIGGGVGIPPLVELAKRMLKKEKDFNIVLGFNSYEEIFSIDMFEKLGINPIVTTIDGSFGIKGLVTDALKNISFDYIFTCGPEPMLKALYNLDVDGQFSFEARMACGFGGCMGCSCKTKYGYKRICKEGPVLFKEEILW